MRAVRRRRPTYGAVFAVLASAVIVAGAAPAGQAHHTGVGAALVDLKSPEEFKRQFNGDRGHVRLVLLLSPT